MGTLMPYPAFQFIDSSSSPIWVAMGGVAFVALILAIAAYRDRQDAAKGSQSNQKPVDIKVDAAVPGSASGRNARPNAASATGAAPSKPKTAEQIFKDAFPELKVGPVPLRAVPFAIRVTEIDASSVRDGRPRPCLRVEVSGSVPLDVVSDLSLLLTVEDLTSGAAQHVFATVDSLQDERTGLFVERASLGKIEPPGLRDKGWREIALIPTSFLQAPGTGRRRLRFSCLCVPSGNAYASVIDPVLRSRIYCTAVAEVVAELPIKGYLDEDYDREQAAGMIMCVAWGFAHALGGSEKKSGPVISAWSAQAASLLGGTSGLPSASLARVLDGADKLGQSGGIGFLDACGLLAKSLVPEAPLMAFDLCCRVAKASGSSIEDSFALLRDGALAMGVGPDEFSRLMSTYLGGIIASADEELVGLDPDWDKERIVKFLREQFGKWNARSGSERDPAERRNIAIRLNAIAKLRQKHR
jgi:hypothetical protein